MEMDLFGRGAKWALVHLVLSCAAELNMKTVYNFGPRRFQVYNKESDKYVSKRWLS